MQRLLSVRRDIVLTILVLLTLVPMAAFGLNLLSGSAEKAPHTMGQTTAAEAIATEHQSIDLSMMVEGLSERLSANPDNLDGWVLLARSYTALNRFEEAAAAYTTALGLSGNDPVLRAAYGEVLVLGSGGTVTPRAKEAFDQVLQARPANPRSRYYLALAEAQAGRGARAIELWQALEADSPPGAPWLPVLRQRIDATAEELGIALAPRQASPPRVDAPNAEDVGSASGMPVAEQEVMIRNMVAGLAARLEKEPDDLEGWLRLARSYRVLGEVEKASEAMNRAESAAKARGPEALREVERVRAGLAADGGAVTIGLTGATHPATPPDDLQSVRHSIERLSATVRTNPEDAESWLQLGRSFALLGENGNARSAFGEALSRQPRNLELLQDYGDAVLEIGTDSAISELPEASLSVLRNLLTVDSGSPQALWLLGLSSAGAGDRQTAGALWRKLLQGLPPGSHQRAVVTAELERLEAQR